MIVLKVGDMVKGVTERTYLNQYGFVIGFDDLSGETEYKIEWFNGIISYEYRSDIRKVS